MPTRSHVWQPVGGARQQLRVWHLGVLRHEHLPLPLGALPPCLQVHKQPSPVQATAAVHGFC